MIRIRMKILPYVIPNALYYVVPYVRHFHHDSMKHNVIFINHSEICCVPYENASRTGLRNLCINTRYDKSQLHILQQRLKLVKCDLDNIVHCHVSMH